MIHKTKGVCYTPEPLAKFMLEKLATDWENKEHLSVLEPSVGDGALVKALLEVTRVINLSLSIDIIDIDEHAISTTEELIKQHLKVICKPHKVDFLDFSLQNINNKYDIIIANPPYINRTRLSDRQKKNIKKIYALLGIDNPLLRNIWAAFLLASTRMLQDDGSIAFILPSEFIHVEFAGVIRKLLLETFQRLDIYTWTNAHFKDIDQDTLVVIGHKKSNEQGIFFTHYTGQENSVPLLGQLSSDKFQDEGKWSHSILSVEELAILEKLRKQLNKISDYCTAPPGIVTAANDYFIRDKETIDKYELSKYAHRIICRGQFVNGKVEFSEYDFKKLNADRLPCYLINIKDKKGLSAKSKKFLKEGTDRKIPLRYKCSNRTPWHFVPNAVIRSEAMFFKRAHLYPKMIKNKANILVTDSAYRITLKERYKGKIDSLIYSFYNLITLTFAELDGRFYGGGVLELTPKEFTSLPMPFYKIDERSFKCFASSFKRKNSIDDILKITEETILKGQLRLKDEEITLVWSAYNKLRQRRLKKL